MDIQIVQPDPSLPKELSAFFGKLEGPNSITGTNFLLIVEKIDEEKASLYIWAEGGWPLFSAGWQRYNAKVNKERGKYKIWFSSNAGTTEITVKGKYLNWVGPNFDVRLRQVL